MAEKFVKKLSEDVKLDKEKKLFSKIEKGIFVKFDERDMDKDGHFVVPRGVKSIGEFAFAHSRIKSVTLPLGVKKVCGHGFYLCKSLEKVRVPSSLQRVESGAFYGCEKLKQMNCPESLVEYTPYSFKYSPICATMREKIIANRKKLGRKMGVKVDDNGEIVPREEKVTL